MYGLEKIQCDSKYTIACAPESFKKLVIGTSTILLNAKITLSLLTSFSCKIICFLVRLTFKHFRNDSALSCEATFYVRPNFI